MFDTLLSLLFPPSHNEELLRPISVLFPEEATQRYDTAHTITSCARYGTAEIQAAILLNKNNGHQRAAVLLANLLADVLIEQLSEEFLWNNQRVLVTPVPLSKAQLRSRGFNQVARILELSPQEIRNHTVFDLLKKTKETRPQKSLDRESRLTNVSNSFTVSSQYSLHDTHVIVVDDVVTTGATLLEAARVLNDAGVKKVTLIALARA